MTKDDLKKSLNRLFLLSLLSIDFISSSSSSSSLSSSSSSLFLETRDALARMLFHF